MSERIILKDLGEMPITVDLGQTKIKLNDDEIIAFAEEIAWEDPMKLMQVAAIIVNQLGTKAVAAICEASETVVQPELDPLAGEEVPVLEM